MIDGLGGLIGISLRDSIYKILGKLGLGIITFGGFQLLYDQALNAITSNLTSLQGVPLQLVTLSGCLEACGIILGAFAVKVSLLALGKFGVLPA